MAVDDQQKLFANILEAEQQHLVKGIIISRGIL